MTQAPVMAVTAAVTGWSAPASPSMGWATPQIETYVEYAGFFKRWGAIIIDGLVVGAAYIGVVIALAILLALGGGLESEEATSDFEGLLNVGYFIALWLYYAFMESSSWQATLGKRALGIIVTDESGNPLSFGRATGRFFARFFSYITLLIGFIMAGFTPKKQALHDMVAGTLVVVGKRH